MTLISRHSILSLQPTQFQFMYGLKQSVRDESLKNILFQSNEMSLPTRSYYSIICFL